MLQDIQQHQGNRSERRQIQRRESKKWRKEEKKMSLAGPNAGRYNPKKIRRGANSISRRTSISCNNYVPSEPSHPIVSIRNREFIIIDKVLDCNSNDAEQNRHINFSPNDNEKEDTTNEKEDSIEKEKMQVKETEEVQATSSIESNEVISGDASSTNDKLIESEIKIVTVSEDPVFSEKFDDKISETPAVKSDTSQEEKLQMNETTQNIVEKEHSDSRASLHLTPVERKQEPSEEITRSMESENIVPTPSVLNVINNDPVVEKPLGINAKDVTSNALPIDKALLSNIVPTTTASTVTASTTDTSNTVVVTTTAGRTKKRSIISRLFKNNKIEIKLKPQEKKLISRVEQPEKKKTKVWQIWKKL